MGIVGELVGELVGEGVGVHGDDVAVVCCARCALLPAFRGLFLESFASLLSQALHQCRALPR